jgi:hypothetical protein
MPATGAVTVADVTQFHAGEHSGRMSEHSGGVCRLLVVVVTLQAEASIVPRKRARAAGAINKGSAFCKAPR